MIGKISLVCSTNLHKRSTKSILRGFLKKIETSKEKWKSIKEKIAKKNSSPNITEIDENGRRTKGKKWVCSAFNIVFSKMGIYRGQIVPLNVEKIEQKFQEFNFRPFTLREIYKVIDNLDNNKAPESGYINAWALKSGKYALGTHLEIIFNDCIQEKVFPTILKDAHITTFFKKGDVSVLTNYCLFSITSTFANFLKGFYLIG